MFGRKLTMNLFIVSRIIGQCILILLAYNIEWQKEWYLLTLIPTALIGKKDRCDKQYNVLVGFS